MVTQPGSTWTVDKNPVFTVAGTLSARFTQQTCFQSTCYMLGLSLALEIGDKVRDRQLQCHVVLSATEQASPRQPVCVAAVNIVAAVRDEVTVVLETLAGGAGGKWPCCGQGVDFCE